MGLEEAGVNQATVWPESGADRAAASRENPVLFPAPPPYNMCLACLHHCPKFAIQYGKNTKKHGQYVHSLDLQEKNVL